MRPLQLGHLAPFTDVTTHPGGHSSVQDKAFLESDSSKQWEERSVTNGCVIFSLTFPWGGL